METRASTYVPGFPCSRYTSSKLTRIYGMLRRALAVNGLAALTLWMPSALQAQLPDAPSAVKFHQSHIQDAPTAREDLSERADRKADAFKAAAWKDDSSASAWTPRLLAFAMEDGPNGQQSIYRPSKQTLGPGPSSSTANLRPVPGSAPILHNACPQDTCSAAQAMMCCGRAPSPFARYLKRPDVVPLTARDNLRSAVKDIIDPFNLLTIVGDSAFGVATDSHSPYGPGVDGIAKYGGVSMTEDLTGEFFGTFLVPSLMHQDPHYHREPFVSIKRRVWHAIVQVVWTQSYTGEPMFNYANVFGGIATAAVSNTFVPGPGRQGWKNTSERLAVAFATSPSGNLITEFVPDIADRINLRVVIFQRILNSVSLEEGGQP